MIGVIWLVAACGWGGPHVVHSVPGEPVADLSGEEGPLPYTMVWSDLAEMFPPSPGMVRPLGSLIPGMPSDAARAVLEEARRPGARIVTREVKGNTTVWSTLKHGTTEIGATLILDAQTDTLRTVDLAVEWGAASSVLLDRWGEPDPGPPVGQGGARYQWSGQPWTVLLYRLVGGTAVIKFQAAGGT